ncbi:MAG TPA: phosphoglycolate phosphatase [Caulobacteraceae bacterium]
MPRPSDHADLRALDGATIAFDLDGTLVDTAPDLVAVLNGLLAEEGLAPLPLTVARPLIGRGARRLIARGFSAAGAPDPEPRMDALFSRFIAAYRGRIARESRPYPGALAALDKLMEAGAKLCLCTNKPTDLAALLMRELSLEERFAAIVGPDAAPAAKPDPAHLIAAITKAGGRLDKAVMVGDSEADAQAARAAGVPLVLVSFGYTEVAAAQLGADILIDHFDQLPAACARLLRPCRRPPQPL